MEGVPLCPGDMNGVLPVEPAKKTGRAGKSVPLSIEQNVLDVLVCRGILSQTELDSAVEEATRGAGDIEALLLDRHHVP